MVFHADTAFAVELLALVAGTALLMHSGKEGVCCKSFGKVVGYFTIIAAILALLCTSYYSVRYWEDGFFRYPHYKMGEKGAGMMECPMMQEKRQEKMMDRMERRRSRMHRGSGPMMDRGQSAVGADSPGTESPSE